MHIRRSILLAAATLILVTVALTGCSKKDSGPTGPGSSVTFNSGNILSGLGFQFVFATEGHYAYHCAIHTQMQSTIHVVAGGLDTLHVNIANSTSSGFQPVAVGGETNVRPGGRVIWTNVTGQTHTVTSD